LKNYTDFYTDLELIFKNGDVLSSFRLKTARFGGLTKPLGGGCYIHLTTEAYVPLLPYYKIEYLRKKQYRISTAYRSYNFTLLLYIFLQKKAIVFITFFNFLVKILANRKKK